MVNATNVVKVGRVFFQPDSGPDVEKVTVLTLDSHVENVVTLVKNFQRDFYPAFRQHQKSTRDLLIRAAEKHDNAKPDTFRVTYRSYKENGRKSLGYSFAGHRFRVSDPDRYVELLIRLHHEFSVEGIVKAQAELKTERELADAKFKNFPFDLYILEMCDQIEAELETYAFTDNVQPRVFMDFHSGRREDRLIEVSPYPFDNEEIPLSLAYYEFDVPDEHRRQIAKALKEDNREKGVNCLRNMIVNSPERAERQQKEMTLCKAH
jgi:CRISPR-associated endonuclease/helicase Cas3